MNEVTTNLGLCQVRGKTERPCPRRAEVEILGVAFCGPCAREQKAYFAIGELTQEGTERLRGGALAEALKMMRRERGTYGRHRRRAVSWAFGCTRESLCLVAANNGESFPPQPLP